MVLTVCPACFSHIKINTSVHEGQILACNKCRATLEVVDVDPIDLDIFVSNSKKQSKKFTKPQKDEFKAWEDDVDEVQQNRRRKSSKRKRSSRPDYI